MQYSMFLLLLLSGAITHKFKDTNLDEAESKIKAWLRTAGSKKQENDSA